MLHTFVVETEVEQFIDPYEQQGESERGIEKGKTATAGPTSKEPGTVMGDT